MAGREIKTTVVCALARVEEGGRLLAVGGSLASRLGTGLTVAHVAPEVPGPADGIAPEVDRRRNRAIERGYELIERAMESEALGSRVQRSVTLGEPLDSLLALAADENAQLLVVGPGRRATSSCELGGVIVGLLRLAPCPLVAVPPGVRSFRLRQSGRPSLLCAFEGSEQSRLALGAAAALASQLRGVAFVEHVGPEGLEQLEARARRERVDLIVAPWIGQPGWDAARPGSPPARLAASGSVPVVFMPGGGPFAPRHA